jgi:aldehyde:ferredoxin oxidoreductase
MYGWMGKILWVNLTDSEIETIATQPYAEKYLGGRGIASRIYWETVNPEISAFDPGNHLVFMTGPLVATGVQGATRTSVTAKSPSSYPEGYSYGNIGGFVGAELKKAGFDGVVIEGRAPKPVYLSIQDNSAEVRDASSLWGKSAYQTSQLLQSTHGEKVRFIVTGVAGERLVRSAVVLASHEGTSRMGFGAVMGSKNLKAITVGGKGGPSVANPDRVRELNRYTIKISQRLKSAAPPGIGASGHGHLLEALGNGGCYQCALECHRKLYRYGNRPDLVGYRRCSSMEYYLPWRYGREDEPVDTFFDAPTLANSYSIDTTDASRIIQWLYSCYRAGALTEEEINLPISKVGTREFLDKLYHSIAYREGFGDILAEGLARSLEQIPAKARAMLTSSAASGGRQESSPAGAVVGYSLIQSMEPRTHPAQTHEVSRFRLAWLSGRSQPSVSPVTNRVFHAVARAFWGSEEAGDLSGYEGKALAIKKMQDRTYLKDSLGLCDAAWPIVYSLATPDNVGDPNLEAELLTAVTGISGEELEPCAGRIFDMQRAILLREGRKVPEADFPAESSFRESSSTGGRGQPFFVPGPDDSVVDAAGKALDKEKFTDLLKEYYRLRGWDEETGLLRTAVPVVGN